MRAFQSIVFSNTWAANAAFSAPRQTFILERVSASDNDPSQCFYRLGMNGVFSDYLNLEALWKVQELDEEWVPFHQQQEKVTKFIEEILVSLYEAPPEVVHQLKNCHDLRTLRYFQEYEHFMTAHGEALAAAGS